VAAIVVTSFILYKCKNYWDRCDREKAERKQAMAEDKVPPADTPDQDMFATFMARAVASNPLLAVGGEYFRSLSNIALGTSTLAADAKDWRFQHSAWMDNPFYRRWSQAYLALSEAVEKIIPDDLPVEDRTRAELTASIAMSMLAPTNTLIGNPAALAQTWESKGANLARGFQNFLTDLETNGGLPSQVDDSEFEVGRNLAVTPGKIVLRTTMFELIHYAPVVDRVHAVPVLLIPPQIGRYYFTDLAPGRSFAEYTVAQGLNYFAMSWRNPSPSERDWGLEDYVEAALEAVRAVTAIGGGSKVNIVGFCAGGILSAILSAVLAARRIDLVNSLTLCVTMLDFKVDASLGAFRLPAMLSMAKAQSERKGVLSGDDLGKIFTLLRPNDLLWNYWVNNYLMGESPPAFDILAWNKDSTNMPARLHADFLELFESNALVEKGRYRIAGESIDLSAIACDAFLVGAITDHLTPWKACYRSRRLLGGDATFALSNGGHIAALVNPPGNAKAWNRIGAATHDDADGWEVAAEKLQGSWWESWTGWAASRSGKRIPAPRALGSKDYPPQGDAPGIYVRERPSA
jgi:polyhydroxyalkanoate synthase